jgi:hypothetical protein
MGARETHDHYLGPHPIKVAARLRSAPREIRTIWDLLAALLIAGVVLVPIVCLMVSFWLSVDQTGREYVARALVESDPWLRVVIRGLPGR